MDEHRHWFRIDQVAEQELSLKDLHSDSLEVEQRPLEDDAFSSKQVLNSTSHLSCNMKRNTPWNNGSQNTPLLFRKGNVVLTGPCPDS